MTETRWLDDDEQAMWRAYMEMSQRLSARLERDLQEDCGMPHAYYEILVRLSDTPDHRLRMSDLAQSAFSSRSRVSHAISRLEDLGWVRREDCPTDRRGQLAVLTDEGYAALVAAAPIHVEGVRRLLFDPLTPEQVAALRSIAESVVQHLPSD